MFSFVYAGFSQTSVKNWENLYKQANTMKSKKELFDKIKNVANKDFDDFLLTVLQDQIDEALPRAVQDRKYFEDWVYTTITIEETIKNPKSGPLLKLLYEKITTVRYKGEILFAIGAVGNRDLIPFLNDELRKFNDLQRNAKTTGKDEAVEGCIKAMMFFKDPSSFYQLFIAAQPYYPEKLRVLAADALKRISDTPSKLCDPLIEKSNDYAIATEALKYSLASNSPKEDKIDSCLKAFVVGLDDLIDPSPKMVEMQRNLRNIAIYNLGELKALNSDAIAVIDRKWKFDKETTINNLTTIEALQKIATKDAANVLISRLAYFNTKSMEGGGTGFTKDEGEKIMLAIIGALGIIGDKVAEPELVRTTTQGTYGNTITTEAQKALGKLK
jgi:hypothetical protein